MIVMSEDRILFKQSRIGTRAQGWLHGREKQSQLPRPVTTKRGAWTEGVKDADRTVSENPGQSQLTSALPCKRRDRKVRRTGGSRPGMTVVP